MKDARLVWDTWRRILTSDALVEAVLHPQDSDPARLGLTADECAILADYASTPSATDINIGMYRRGLVRNALNALRLVPLTRRLLTTSGLDVAVVAEDFARSIHNRDHGPYFWRIAAAFVAYLAKVPEFSSPVRQDVLSLEAVAVALVRRLGEAPPTSWPESAAPQLSAARESDRYLASRAVAVASSNYDLTPWLEDPLGFAVDEELEPATRHWLIYVPSAGAAHTYAELSARAARALTLLSEPKTATELSPMLEGLPVAEVLEVLDSLAEIGAVVRGEEA